MKAELKNLHLQKLLMRANALLIPKQLTREPAKHKVIKYVKKFNNDT